MKTRLKELRKCLGLTQTQFGEKIGVKGNTITNYETGTRTPSDAHILSICREFGVDEVWLRTGAGEPFHKPSREDELGTLVASLLRDRPESFRSRLITSLLRFDPASPEWEVLEHIYNSIAEEKPER